MNIAKQFRRTATYVLTRVLVGWLNFAPRRLALFTGSVLGLAIWSILARDRYKIFRHLTLVYADHLMPQQKDNIGRDFFINSGKNLADIVRLRSHYASEMRPLITSEGLEHFDAAYRRGRGVLGITGHIGNFELLAVYMASLGYNVAVVGREMYDPRLDRLLVGNREALGLTNISTTESPRRLLEWLRNGGTVGVLIDIDSIRIRSIFVPVFGRLALTPIGQTIIGLKAKAAFVPVVCLRTADNRYRVICKPEVTVEPSGDLDRDVYCVTRECSRVLETIIDEHRDQWIWLKNRWLTSPDSVT